MKKLLFLIYLLSSHLFAQNLTKGQRCLTYLQALGDYSSIDSISVHNRNTTAALFRDFRANLLNLRDSGVTYKNSKADSESFRFTIDRMRGRIRGLEGHHENPKSFADDHRMLGLNFEGEEQIRYFLDNYQRISKKAASKNTQIDLGTFGTNLLATMLAGGAALQYLDGGLISLVNQVIDGVALVAMGIFSTPAIHLISKTELRENSFFTKVGIHLAEGNPDKWLFEGKNYKILEPAENQIKIKEFDKAYETQKEMDQFGGSLISRGLDSITYSKEELDKRRKERFVMVDRAFYYKEGVPNLLIYIRSSTKKPKKPLKQKKEAFEFEKVLAPIMLRN